MQTSKVSDETYLFNKITREYSRGCDAARPIESQWKMNESLS